MTPPLPLDEARERLLALARPMPIQSVPVARAAGSILAAPLVANRTQPSADLSAMDGYALSGIGPWSVIGESKCGAAFSGVVTSGEAVRISTGAIMPQGTDRVLLQEDAERSADTVTSTVMPPSGKHIRRAGFDFRSGDTLLPAGSYIGPAQIALALSAGRNSLETFRRPVVTIIDSGDELAADAYACLAGQIPASNGAMLAAMIAGVTAETHIVGPVPDRMEALIEAFDSSADCDVVVTSGGASVGDHDLIRPALTKWGAELDFWRVAIKPGKPLMVARRGQQIILGLPGNPVSSFVTAFLFLMPLLRKMGGDTSPVPFSFKAPACTDLAPAGPRAEFMRAAYDGASLVPLQDQDSSALRSLASANALIERPANSAGVKAGTYVPFYLVKNG